MGTDTRKIRVDDKTIVSSVWAIPEHYDRNLALVIAHGAGNDMHNPFISYLHTNIADKGVLCVKFNFPYKEQGRRAPDHANKLMQTWRAVINEIDTDPELSPAHVFLSGKSLGGRMASMVVAEDVSARGLIFFGYPLHPPKQTDKLRVAHFEKIACSMLFIQGTRDPLCDLELLRQKVIDRYPDLATLHIIEGGDHSFGLLKKMDRTEDSVWGEIVAVTDKWMNGPAFDQDCIRRS
ncbi:MAG: alpha/beta hydrolase [Arenicellales bacterium]|nr:alpha/beta hydrolase [Arenicellales bacterium]